MNEKTLEKLNKLLELSQNDTVTPKELGNFLVMVLDVIKKSKGEFDKISSENVQIIKDSIDFIETSHSKILSQVDEQNGKLIEDTDKKLKQAQDMFNEIKAMSFSDGKDGENGKDGVDGKDGENGKDGSPDTGEEIIKKINNVTVEDDKYKIDAKHIKNLPENTKGGGRGLAKVFTDDTMEGDGTISNPLTVVSGGGGVQTIVAGANISVDSTDPANPIVTSLSDRYKTTSTTSQAIVSTGTLTFTVDANLAYTPQQDVMIVYDASNHMHGTVNSYSGTTLVVDITHKTGSGTYASWTINLDGLPAGGSGWELTGNAGTTAGTNFIGTTDDVDHVFKRNNVEFFRNRKATNRSNRTEVFLPQGIDLSFARSDGYFLGINTNSNVGYGDNTLSLWGVNGMNFSVHNGDFTWYNSSSFITPRMTLKNTTGNFLIGTTTDAGYKLDVNGTGIFRDVLTIKKAGNSAGIILEETTPGYYSPDIQFKGISGNVFGKISVDYMNLVIGAGSNKYVGFGLVGQAGDYAVTINSYPYGVNTAPNNFVQRITQTANNAVGLVIKNSTAQSPSPTANFLEFRNASNSVLSAVTSGGSLLLGTSTDAGYKLDVNGTGRFSDNLQLEKSTSSGVGINVYNPLYTNRSFRFYLNGASAAVPSWNNATIIESYAADGGLIFSSVGGIGSSNAPFIWQMGGARGEVMRISTGGRLLLGTTTDGGFKFDTLGTGRFTALSATDKVLTVRGTTSQTANLQEWQNIGGTILSSVKNDGSIKPASIADSSASNDSIYYSTTAGKLVYKDSSGAVGILPNGSSTIPLSLQTITTTNQLIPMGGSLTTTSDIVNWSYTNLTANTQKVQFTMRGEIQRKLAVGTAQLAYQDGVELYGITGFASQALQQGRDFLQENSSINTSTNLFRARTVYLSMVGTVAPGATVTVKARAYGSHASGLDTSATADNTTYFCDSSAEIMTLSI